MNPWDQRFSSEDYLFGTEPAAALLKLESHLIAGGQTLVVADGEGRNSTFLAGKGYRVQATDYSEVGLAKARKLATRMGVSVDYQLQNIFDVDWTAQQFDNVVAVFEKALEMGLNYKNNPHEDDFMNDVLDLLDDTKPKRKIGGYSAAEEKKDDDFTF